MFVRSYVGSYFLPKCYWNLEQSSFSSGIYLNNHSSESIHIWIIGTMEDWLHSMTPDPWWDYRSKSRTPLKNVSTFFVIETTYEEVGQMWFNLVTMTCGS